MHRMSAFMDGESGSFEARQMLNDLKQSDDSRLAWEAYHLAGDVLRGEPPIAGDFMARFRERMDQEPIVIAPHFARRNIYNIALSAAASLAAVAVVLAVVFTDNPLTGQGGARFSVAQSPAPQQDSAFSATVTAANQSRVNEYLMAHQEFSPSTVLQGVAPYVRTISAAYGSGER